MIIILRFFVTSFDVNVLSSLICVMYSLLFFISSLFSMFPIKYSSFLGGRGVKYVVLQTEVTYNTMFYIKNLFLWAKSSSVCLPNGTQIYNPRHCGQCEDRLMQGLNPCLAFFKFKHCILVFMSFFIFISFPHPHPRGRKGQRSTIQDTAASVKIN